jgi:magnesium transporter
MIKLYGAEGGELWSVDTQRLKDALWIDAVAPTPDEVEKLHDEFKIDLQDVADCLDPNERSRVEIDEAYDLLVLRSVLAEQHDGDRVQTMPIGIFVVKDRIITVRLGSSFTYQELTAEQKRKPRIDTKEDLFLAIVRRINKDIERRVRPMERTIAGIQEEVVKTRSSDLAHHAFVLSNELILLNTTLLGNLNAISMMPKAKHLKFTKERLDLAEDIENDVAQLYEMTTIYREIVSNILNANELAAANNLSTVMKILTTISLTLMLPTLLASLYGMNVDLPFQHSNVAFFIVLGLAAVSVVGLWLIFRIKRIL